MSFSYPFQGQCSHKNAVVDPWHAGYALDVEQSAANHRQN